MVSVDITLMTIRYGRKCLSPRTTAKASSSVSATHASGGNDLHRPMDKHNCPLGPGLTPLLGPFDGHQFPAETIC